MHKWDRVGALRFVPAACSDPAFRCGLFATPKDETRLRQILNPMPENARAFGSSLYCKSLVAAFDLAPLVVPEGYGIHVYGDDLTDMYHQFVVSPARALRNHLRAELSADEASAFGAYDRSLGPG
eukprot:11209454-Lingulodinium_polyedra.AAC.1